MSRPIFLAKRLIRFLERYVHADLSYLISGSIWLGIVQIAGMLSSLILAIGLAHFVSKDTFGIYKYVLSIATLVSAFAYSGLSTSLVQQVAKGDVDTLRRSFMQYLRKSGLIVVFSLTIAVYYALHANYILTASFVVAGLCLPVLGAATLYDSYLQGKRAFKMSAVLSFFNTGIPALILVLVAWFMPHPLPIVIGYFIANALVDYSLYRYTLRRFPEPRSVGNSTPDRYSADLSAMNILTVFSTQIDQLLLFHLSGAAELAVYAYAIALPEQGKGFTKNIGSLALPKFVQHSRLPSRRQMGSQMLIMSAVIGIPVAVYILSAPYIFAFLFPSYTSSVLYSQIFAISLLSSSNVLPSTYLQAQKNTRALYGITIVSAIFQIICIIIGGLWYGILGIVIARVVGRFASSFYTLVAAT